MRLRAPNRPIPLAECNPTVQRMCNRWTREVVERYPAGIRKALSTEIARLNETDYYAANIWRNQVAGSLDKAHLTRAYDEEQIRDFAENYARACRRIRSPERRLEFVRSLRIDPPAGPNMTIEGIVARLEDPKWWCRQLRQVWTRSAENAARDLGIVRAGKAPYVSDEAVKHRRLRQTKARDFLASCSAINEAGEELDLLKVVDGSVSNPALRRGEFMCRARGFEEMARDLGHVAEFITLTAPSILHAQLKAGGRNPKYQGATVSDAQKWLQKQWARARAKLKRSSVTYYGFRIAEPHHDGTPHWHLLLFVPPHQVEILRRVLRDYWLAEHADEPGAAAIRCRFDRIDPAKGSATGYVAKYVAKNIDGAGTIGSAEDHETGRRVADGVARVDAWASIHGIRQFQQIGGPPVTLWRESRRIRDPVEDEQIERVRSAAERGEWGEFIYALSPDHIHAGRSTSVTIEKQVTGECNRYMELRAPEPLAVRSCSGRVITRPHCWRLVRKRADHATAGAGEVPAAVGFLLRNVGFKSEISTASYSDLGPVAITVRGGDRDCRPMWAKNTSSCYPIVYPVVTLSG